jgi:CubicO group peptidase (beta-lactamase class C family)
MRMICLLCGVLIVALASSSSGQPLAAPYSDSKEIPQTPAYRRAIELVDLINSGDGDALEKYAKANFAEEFLEAIPLSTHRELFDRMRDLHGELQVHSARSYDPPRPATQAVLIVRGKTTDLWRGISLDVEAAEPHRLVGFTISMARLPSDLANGEPLSPDQIAEQLGAYVEQLAGDDQFSGTLLLAKDGKVLVTKSMGTANRDFNVPVTLDTKFNLGSMNKMMTAVACLQLVEAGKLSLDSPVSQFLDDDWLPNVDKTKIQLKHLLTHSSGLGSYFTDEWDRSSRALYRSIDDWKPICQAETLSFEPGTNWMYSNTGMLIAGAIVEKASGVDYYQYVRDHITGPAGMSDSDFYETDRVNHNLAVGYEKEHGPQGTTYRNNLYQHVVRGGPAGGGYSTVGDLLKFGEALRQGKLLRTESLEKLWRPYPELSSPSYGLGFAVNEGPAGRVVGHGGGFPGISASLKMYLDRGYTVVVLANLGEAADIVDEKAMQLILAGETNANPRVQ